MKKSIKKFSAVAFGLLLIFQISTLMAQVPQSFSYQAVVRDAQGNVLPNQNVAFRFSIVENNANGNVVYSETQTATTNNLGLVVLAVGNGNNPQGSFSNIQWGNAPHFLKVELDINGGSNFIEMGTTQLLSVPYALHAQTAANVQTYTAGNGINITGNVIENTSPDQPINITGNGATTVTGTYPNFTISSTDNNTTYNAGTGLSLTGTTFSHAPHTGDVSGTNHLTVTGIQGKPISTTAPTSNQVLQYNGTQWEPTQPTNLITAGSGLNYTGNTLNTVWTQTGNNIYNNNTGRVGIGLTAPTGKVTIQGDTSNVLFEVRDKNGIPVFTVYQDSVKISVTNTGAKSNKGVFIVNGKAQTKAGNHHVFRVVPDSIVEIKDAQGLPVFQAFQDSVKISVDNSSTKSNKGVFIVNGKAQTKAGGTNYLRISPDSSRIYTEDPNAGFGVRDLSGGNATSYMQLTPENYFIGHEAGSSNTTGKYNLFLGYKSGKNNSTGKSNTFIGRYSGYTNTTGEGNVIVGDSSGFNLNGYFNTIVGFKAGLNHTGNNGTFIGTTAGMLNSTGNYNTFIGNSAGGYNTTGSNNTYLGTTAGSINSSGDNNTMIGALSGCSNFSFIPKVNSNNTFIGSNSGFNITYGSYNCLLGAYSGYSLTSGSYNILIGYNAGYNETGSNKLYIENSNADANNALIYGEFDNDVLRFNSKVGIGTYPNYKLHVTGSQASGSGTGLIHAVNTATGNDAAGIYASCKNTDYYGYGGYFEGGFRGVYGLVSPSGTGYYAGVYGEVNSSSGSGIRYGIYGKAAGPGTTNYGIFATASGATTNWAGYFQGNVHVNGTLSKSAGTFKIDHPLDPENKYLIHSFVESPDMKNVYDGVVVLDAQGKATVTLPSYFEVLNKDFRYQLTCIGGYAPVYIEKKIHNNIFTIAGGYEGLEVSWQVTGIRKDPYAVAHPITVEQEKNPYEKGKYLNPELYHQPKEKAIDYIKEKENSNNLNDVK